MSPRHVIRLLWHSINGRKKLCGLRFHVFSKKALPEEAVDHDEEEAGHGQKKSDAPSLGIGHAAHDVRHEGPAENGRTMQEAPSLVFSPRPRMARAKWVGYMIDIRTTEIMQPDLA